MGKVIIMIIAFAIIVAVMSKTFIFMVEFGMPLILLMMGMHIISSATLAAAMIRQFIPIMGIVIFQEGR